MSKFGLISGYLLVLTGVIHFAITLIYGLSETIGYLVFAILYLLLGILLLIYKKRRLIWITIILTSIGFTAGTVATLSTGLMISSYITVALIDVVIITCCILELRTNKR